MIRRARRSRWAWWFALGALAVIAVLTGITVMTLGLEKSEREASREAETARAMSEALLRIDSWLAPQLEMEALRPHFHYHAFYSQEQAYTRLLGRIEPGEVLTPSPLLWFRSEIFPLHFQLDVGGTLSSPQAPEGNLRDLAEGHALSRQDLPAMVERVTRWRRVLDRDALLTSMPEAESNWLRLLGDEPDLSRTSSELSYLDNGAVQSIAGTRSNLGWRAKTSRRVATPQRNASQAVSVGRLLPLWYPGETRELLFARTARRGEELVLQGFVADWPRLEAALLAQVEDLFPAARLRPVATSHRLDPTAPGLLGTLPAILEPGRGAAAEDTGSSVVALLLVTWAVVLAALGGFAISLKRSVDESERRRRFASAVTHELRTPLTTFRMYSEMLAEGMVTEPDQVATYLDTLQSESTRLGTLVENVLEYARLEEGRREGRREEITGGALLERLRPRLESVASMAAAELAFDESPEARAAPTEVNVEAVGQILANLVDNAGKYGRDEAGIASVTITASRDGRNLDFTVTDRGPGIPASKRAAVFGAFHRGDRDEADAVPGIGLGLALARGLAEDQGGSLELLPDAQGTAFRLRLPLQ